MTALDEFHKDPAARELRRADLARVQREFIGAGGSPVTLITLPVTLTRCVCRVTIPEGQGACTEVEHSESATIVVDEIFAGPAVNSTAASEVASLVNASLIADPRYPAITTNAAALRMIITLAGVIMGKASVDDKNNITIISNVDEQSSTVIL